MAADVQKPHSRAVVAAVDALRRWGTTPYERDLAFSAILANVHSLEEQLQTALPIIEAVAAGRVGPAHGVLARDLLSNPAERQQS